MTRHVAIIGAGVEGLCAAYYCRSKGLDVTVIERQPSRREGASFANAGIVVPSHVVPLAAPGAIERGLRSMVRRDGVFAIRARWSWSLLRWAWLFRRASTSERVRSAAPKLRDLHLASLALFEDLAQEAGGAFRLERRGLLMLCSTIAGLDQEVGMPSSRRGSDFPPGPSMPGVWLNWNPTSRLRLRAVSITRRMHTWTPLR